MDIGNIIFSLISLILLTLVILSPLIRNIVKTAGKRIGGIAETEDSSYEKVNSQKVVQRILSETEEAPQIVFTEPEPLRAVHNNMYENTISAARKLDRMSPLKKAVIWKEILDKPVGLRD